MLQVPVGSANRVSGFALLPAHEINGVVSNLRRRSRGVVNGHVGRGIWRDAGFQELRPQIGIRREHGTQIVFKRRARREDRHINRTERRNVNDGAVVGLQIISRRKLRGEKAARRGNELVVEGAYLARRERDIALQ